MQVSNEMCSSICRLLKKCSFSAAQLFGCWTFTNVQNIKLKALGFYKKNTLFKSKVLFVMLFLLRKYQQILEHFTITLLYLAERIRDACICGYQGILHLLRRTNIFYNQPVYVNISGLQGNLKEGVGGRGRPSFNILALKIYSQGEISSLDL